MGAENYNINVIGRYVDKLTKPLTTSVQTVKRLQKNMSSVSDAVNNSLTKHKSFNSLWTETGNRIKKNIPVMDKLNFSTENLTKINQRNARQHAWMTRQYSMGAQGLVNNASQMNKMSEQYQTFGSVMKMTLPDYKKFIEGGGQFATKSSKAAGAIRNFTHGVRGFRMEMLGVMFFGMMLQKTFSSMLKPAGELVGIFELWGIMLELVFLPVMLALLPAILDVTTWFMGLSDETKTIIGIFAIAGLVFGTLIFLLGQMTLGIGSLILVGALLGVGVGFLLAAFVACFTGIVFIIWGFINVFKGQMDGIGLLIMGVGLILLAFIGWWALIPIAVGMVVWLLIKYWKEFKFFFTQLWLSIKITFKKVIKWIVQAWADVMKFLSGIPIIGGLFSKAAADSQAAANNMASDISDMEALYRRNNVDKWFGLGDWASEQEDEAGAASNGIMDKLGLGMDGSNSIVGDGMSNLFDTTSLGMEGMSGAINTGMVENVDLTKMGIDTMGSDWDSGMSDMYESTDSWVTKINRRIGQISTGGGSSSQSKDYFGEGFGSSTTGTSTSSSNDSFFGKGFNDFIWRPGSAPTPINSNDTLVGTKNGGMGVTIANTYNVVVSDKAEFEKMLRAHDQELLNKISRNT